MNFKQRMCILGMVFAIFLITLGNGLSFISNYREDVSLKTTIVNQMSQEYESFADQSVLLRNELESFNRSIGTYYDTMLTTNVETLEHISNATSMMDTLVPMAESLRAKCAENGNIDSLTAQKCAIFEQNYETLTSTYVRIIDSYNHVVSGYNAWAMQNNQEQILPYSSIYYEQFR
ncbi:unknown [Bacillus sp. CAG:988]|nr:unknown [Bacillus sp. CAG:988]